MQNYKLLVYSKEPPTPRQLEVLGDVLQAYRERRGIKIEVSTDLGQAGKLLVFGSTGPEGAATRATQYTYSPRQMETRANTQTVLFSALDSYFGMVEGLPEDHAWSWTAWADSATLAGFDLTKPIAVDVETGGTLGENVTARTAPMLTIAFAQGDRSVALVLHHPDVDNTHPRIEDNVRYLQELLPSIEKPIFHNGKFDIAVIEHNTGIRMPNWFDTMLAHHAMNHAAREHGLKPLCMRYFNAADWERNIKTWVRGAQKDYSLIPAHHLAQYNCYDVLWTYRLWEKLSVDLEADEEAQKAYYLEMQAANFLYDVEATGIPVSTAEVAELRELYANRAEEARATLQSLVGDDGFNPGSPKQVKEVLAVMGINIDKTDEETIENLRQSAVQLGMPEIEEFCVELIKFRKAKKMISTYVEPWAKAAVLEMDLRVHPTFKVHGTTTGRLSSSEPNAQNVPRDKTIRKMVTIDESNQLV